LSGIGSPANAMIEQAGEILSAGPICAECLGRAFGRIGRGLANGERGEALRTVLAMLGLDERPGACWVCGGLFERADVWADRAAALAGDAEFDTYLFGVRLTPKLAEMAAHFEERFPTGTQESLKHAFNRSVGVRFERLFSGKTVDFESPDMSFLIDLADDAISLHVASLYLLGRYRKLVRGIPQTRWPCRRCRGRGCEACDFTGKQYQESVEEWVAAPFVQAARADGERFHGAGREDIDARMLGTGRPFVLELLSPKRRTLDVGKLCVAVNETASGKVEVSRLCIVGRGAVETVKETRASKRYRAAVEFSGDVEEGQLSAALRSLIGEIEQRTPRRVAHRRSDLVRRRRLHEAVGRLCGRRAADVEFATQGGLYVKELVSGDEGRTMPNLAQLLGVDARVTELDVLDVDWPDALMDIPHELP